MFQETEQARLIEKLGLQIEERMTLSPLASRIYALLILSPYDGLTFEEIKEVIQASKSSTSVNINVLVQLNYIKFYTKPGDRRRYFQISKYNALVSLENYQNEVQKEIEIISTINNFNKMNHPEKFSSEKILGDIFEEYLEEKKQLIERTINKMNQFLESEKF
ncbi:MAG: GbsR/MarR family transcriptional regulator [Flavobacterium sp.]